MFTKGQTLYCKSLNMKGHPCVCKTFFAEYRTPQYENGFDCVIKFDGLSVLCHSTELHETPTVLRKQCRSERAAWQARVDQQLAAARDSK